MPQWLLLWVMCGGDFGPLPPGLPPPLPPFPPPGPATTAPTDTPATITVRMNFFMISLPFLVWSGLVARPTWWSEIAGWVLQGLTARAHIWPPYGNETRRRDRFGRVGRGFARATDSALVGLEDSAHPTRLMTTRPLARKLAALRK